jgi:hypothetical protein
MQEADTSWKWRRHLSELQDFDMLEPCTKTSLKYTSRYFAVPKDTEKARAIVNMKQLSKLLRTPGPVNFS